MSKNKEVNVAAKLDADLYRDLKIMLAKRGITYKEWLHEVVKEKTQQEE